MSMDVPQRLGFLITSLEGGGAERIVSSLARALVDHDRNLLVFEDEVVYPFDGDIHLVDVPIIREMSRTERMVKMLKGVVQLRTMRQKLNLDTCISFLTWPNLYNVLSCRGERTIISVRNNPSRSLRGPFAPVLKGLIRLLYPRADHIVAISEDVRRDLIDHFDVAPSRITTIYNPIRRNEVLDQADQPLPKPLASLPDYPSIITVGRLAVQKGHWHLVRSFERLRRRVDDSRLIILGVGPLRDYLVGLARKLGLDVWVYDEDNDAAPLEHDVIFWGFAHNPFPIMRHCDIFAFPSLWEGLGNVIIESLVCEVPVVSADCRSGPREILAPDTPLESRTTEPEWADYGVLLPMCDGNRYDHTTDLTHEERVWADVLTRLLRDPPTRKHYAHRGPNRAADFDLQGITAQWRRLLENPLRKSA